MLINHKKNKQEPNINTPIIGGNSKLNLFLTNTTNKALNIVSKLSAKINITPILNDNQDNHIDIQPTSSAELQARYKNFISKNTENPTSLPVYLKDKLEVVPVTKEAIEKSKTIHNQPKETPITEEVTSFLKTISTQNKAVPITEENSPALFNLINAKEKLNNLNNEHKQIKPKINKPSK